jgi:hypothetical protein
MRNARKLTALLSIIALATVMLTFTALNVYADSSELKLSPTSGSLTPTASGTIHFSFAGGVLSGSLEAQGLPTQGSTAAYGLWFVNLSTGDKVFLGPLVEDGAHSILFQTSGNGQVSFSATTFTAGPGFGTPITLASAGNNLFILLVENNINFASPSPVGSALSGTF